MGHHRHQHDPKTGDAQLFWAVVANLSLTVIEIGGGLLSGRLALIADAVHNFFDAVSLNIAYFARTIAHRPADENMTFGYGRAEVVAALVNYLSLIFVGFYLIYEAGTRFLNPSNVDGWIVVAVAGVALVVDILTAFLTFSLSKHSMNIRAAFLHNLADALGSIAVILVGTLILLFDWRLIDPFVTLLIASYILWISFSEIGSAIRILMLARPDGLDVDAVLGEILTIDGVASAHHLHLWQMQEHEAALDSHIVIEAERWNDADTIKQAVKARLQSACGITHTTLELECSQHACKNPITIGHARDASADKVAPDTKHDLPA